MKTAKIPATVTVKSGTFSGTYKKQSGSRRDNNLFCWFNEEDDNLPHISIDISHEHENFETFHVTFPVKKEKGGWSKAGELERVSYSVHFRIDPETDVVTPTRTTDASRWVLPAMEKRTSSLGFSDMDRKAKELAKEFYSAAFLQAI